MIIEKHPAKISFVISPGTEVRTKVFHKIPKRYQGSFGCFFQQQIVCKT
jgi:hypothetical protein